jgi:hypothetical protein
MQLPVKAKIKWQGLIDAETGAQDSLRAIAHRVSTLSASLATAPASEAGSIEHELSRQRAKQSAAQDQHYYLANQNARVRHFLLEKVGKAQLEDVKTRPAKLEKGETLKQAATRIRARIAALKVEHQKITNAALPVADQKKAAAIEVARLAEKGKPKLSIGHDHFSVALDAMVASSHAPVVDLAAILAWVDPAALLARLSAQIDEQPKPSLALSAKVRAERLEAISIELLVLEHEDEQLVEASEIEGPVLARRNDCDIRALLAISVNRGRPAPVKPAAKLDRVKVADRLPADPGRRMTQRELIEAFGNNRLPGLAGE